VPRRVQRVRITRNRSRRSAHRSIHIQIRQPVPRVVKPAAQIIRLSDAQNGFNVSGTGIVAVIDTGVDTTHPVLQPVLLPGYDFTRNQPGASEWLDVPQLQNGETSNSSADQGPVLVQQSSVAVLDQSSVAVLDGGPYSAFGHGTMTTGLVHLVAPNAKILPLKAFTSNGSGYLSNNHCCPLLCRATPSQRCEHEL